MGLFRKKSKLEESSNLDLPPPFEQEEPKLPSAEELFSAKEIYPEELEIPPIESPASREKKFLLPEKHEEKEHEEEHEEPQEEEEEHESQVPLFPTLPEEQELQIELPSPDLQPFPLSAEVSKAQKTLEAREIPKKEELTILDYDKLLEEAMQQKPEFFQLTKGIFFLSVTQYKTIMDNIAGIKNNMVIGDDTSIRLNLLQEECGKKYDQYQQDFDRINKHLLHLEETLFK